MAEDVLSTTHDYHHQVSLVSMLKHFLYIHECFGYQEVQ